MNFAGVRVLIVDSDPHATRILSKMLNGFGLTLQTVVDSGEKAKAELDKSPFELLICEAVFPICRPRTCCTGFAGTGRPA